MQILKLRCFIPFSFVLCGFVMANPLPQEMSAIGDSTSTATLAQYKRSQAMNPIYHVSVIYDFFRFALSGGDRQKLSDWKLSWSTGTGSRKVLSHAGRLKKLNHKLKVSNFAEPSANIDRVYRVQLPNLKKWSQEAYKKNYPDYLTILVGANDICADSLEGSTPINKYISTYRKILTEILSNSKSTKVLVAALPPYQDLRGLESAGLLAFPGLNKCGGFWKIAPLCKSITHGDAQNTRRVASKVKTMNSSLKQLVNELKKRYGDRVRLAEKLAARNIYQEDLSIDCFHPNAAAQNDIAELSWASSWWVN